MKKMRKFWLVKIKNEMVRYCDTCEDETIFEENWRAPPSCIMCAQNLYSYDPGMYRP